MRIPEQRGPGGRQATGDWKSLAIPSGTGFYTLVTEDTGAVPVRIFMTPELLADLEDGVYPQIVNATRFPGVRLVVITPDAHVGYGVPVGCVLVTDGTVAMGPVGYDIGCGMIAAQSSVDWHAATDSRRAAFNAAVIEAVGIGAGGASRGRLAGIDRHTLERVVREGAGFYAERFGERIDRGRAERDRIPVDDAWQIPWGGRGRPERGISQLGSLGAGNHFVELQRSLQTDTLFVQVHTGSRGFGHGLATNYFEVAQAERPAEITALDLGYFTPDSPGHSAYLNAVVAGANFAICNRLAVFEAVSAAFASVFGSPLELVYEISHNLVQEETQEGAARLVHRKGATRALPAGHSALIGTRWAETGHPVLIPGSNTDASFILRPAPGAEASAFSVNHGAGRRMSRGQARRDLDQATVNAEYAARGIVVNSDGNVPLDESGACYKPAGAVIDAVVGAGLATIEHHLIPLASVKDDGTRTRRGRR